MNPLVRNAILGPGPTLHELAHVAVARRYADVDLEPGLLKSTVRIHWDDEVPVWGVIWTYLAPVLLGGILLIAVSPFVGVLAALPWPVQVYLGVNYLLLAGPSLTDVLDLLRILGDG